MSCLLSVSRDGSIIGPWTKNLGGLKRRVTAWKRNQISKYKQHPQIIGCAKMSGASAKSTRPLIYGSLNYL